MGSAAACSHFLPRKCTMPRISRATVNSPRPSQCASHNSGATARYSVFGHRRSPTVWGGRVVIVVNIPQYEYGGGYTTFIGLERGNLACVTSYQPMGRSWIPQRSTARISVEWNGCTSTWQLRAERVALCRNSWELRGCQRGGTRGKGWLSYEYKEGWVQKCGNCYKRCRDGLDREDAGSIGMPPPTTLLISRFSSVVFTTEGRAVVHPRWRCGSGLIHACGVCADACTAYFVELQNNRVLCSVLLCHFNTRSQHRGTHEFSMLDTLTCSVTRLT